MDSPSSSETEMCISETSQSPKPNVERRRENRVILPYGEYRKTSLIEDLSPEELFDDLFDDYVLRLYSNHPGFPRTDEEKHRYRKFVYYDSSLNFCQDPMSRAMFREAYVKEYIYQVHNWFEQGDWERFPGVLTPEEVEALNPELKQKYTDFCEDAFEPDVDIGDIKFQPEYFRWRKKAWDDVRSGRKQWYSDSDFVYKRPWCNLCFPR